MNITFVIRSMLAGGAQRVLSILANHWAGQGKSITLLSFDSAPSFYTLHPDVKIITLDLEKRSPETWQRVWDNYRRIRILRKNIIASKPDLVISFLVEINVQTLLACRGLSVPVFVREGNDPTMHRVGWIWETLRSKTYRKAHKVISVSNGVDRFFDWLPPEKRQVIYNPVQPLDLENVDFDPPEDWDSKKKHLIGMGRLVPQKGFDLLLRSLKPIFGRFNDWQVFIFGEGPSHSNLVALRDELGLQGQVFFPGLIQNPFPMLMQSDLFVLPSRHEGFVNVLCEAKACGLPVVSFDCPSSPSEIVRPGVDGLLVPPEDVEGLTSALSDLMEDSDLRQSFSSRAKEINLWLNVQRLAKQWERLIDQSLIHRD